MKLHIWNESKVRAFPTRAILLAPHLLVQVMSTRYSDRPVTVNIIGTMTVISRSYYSVVVYTSFLYSSVYFIPV